ncbi:hypothetical protein [Paludibacter sp.]|uniref:hypothetical protein n=1 Tax=Paludibacter sp. TaxID=1898105 RepID=UPI001354F3F2|nr:hypothetical protein [Paludibacter sp.]MTK52648.1 hypothetical protein [Paludibacter sp.]
MVTYKLTTYKILSTGVDGGHHYISAEINFGGQPRKITVLFKNKSDEKLLKENTELTVSGNFIDDGLQQSLMLLDAEIVN